MAKDKQSKKNAKKKSTTRVSGMEGGSRIKDMSVELPEEVGKETELKTVTAKKVHLHGKKIVSARSEVKTDTVYTPDKAVELLKKTSISKFVGTVELHLNTLVKDLSGDIKLPHYQGKTQKVAVFDDTIAAELKAGQISFDVLLTSPTDMPKVLPFAKLLGPKGLMPNPKNGTLVADPLKAKDTYGTAGMHYKTEKDFPLIHLAIGKTDQPTDELVANYKAVVKAIGIKNLKQAYVKSTMGPAIKIAF